MRRRVGDIEHLIGSHNTIGVDIPHSLCSNIDLWHADGRMGRDDLAVDVCEADFVLIDQIERADAGSRQSLDRVAAYAADPEYRYARVLQFFHTVRTEQQLSA